MQELHIEKVWKTVFEIKVFHVLNQKEIQSTVWTFTV